jgi:hypothetical protein
MRLTCGVRRHGSHWIRRMEAPLPPPPSPLPLPPPTLAGTDPLLPHIASPVGGCPASLLKILSAPKVNMFMSSPLLSPSISSAAAVDPRLTICGSKRGGGGVTPEPQPLPCAASAVKASLSPLPGQPPVSAPSLWLCFPCPAAQEHPPTRPKLALRSHPLTPLKTNRPGGHPPTHPPTHPPDPTPTRTRRPPPTNKPH